MRNDRVPTKLGQLVLERMNALGMRRQRDLVRPGLSDSTISRLIYAEYLPDTKTLGLLAGAIGVDADELVLFVHGRGDEAVPPDGPAREIHRFAAELDRMLAPDSPLEDADRQMLEAMWDRVADPYRKLMRRKRPA